jgi:hypothetical protein
MPRVAGLLWSWLPVLVWMATILTLSGQSDLPTRVNAQAGETIRSTFTLAKFGHVIEYSVLALLVLRALCGAAGGVALPLGRAIVMTVVAAALFGGLDELRQSLVPNREPRLSDIALDTVSALVALLAVAGWQRLRQSVMSARTAQAREGSRA